MTEKKNCISSDAEVTRRLITILVLMIGLICVFGGYMLGRMARNEINRKELLTFNLTALADKIYKKSKAISPKAVHNHDTETIRRKLLTIFNCTHCVCPPTLDKYNLSDFIKNIINMEIEKLMKSIHNASVYLDSLR